MISRWLSNKVGIIIALLIGILIVASFIVSTIYFYKAGVKHGMALVYGNPAAMSESQRQFYDELEANKRVMPVDKAEEMASSLEVIAGEIQDIKQGGWR